MSDIQKEIGRKEVYFYDELDNVVICKTCPHECELKVGERGICRTRINIDGRLYNEAYGKPCSATPDPIQKKPFFHFLPGTLTYSIATVGCNFRCKFCQNWQISQALPDQIRHYEMTPTEIVADSIATNCKSIAYTYTGPVAFYEYMHDIAEIAYHRGIKNIIKDQMYLNPKPLENLCKYLSGASVDLKFFREDLYRKYSGASLQYVLDNLIILKQNNIWLEIVNLIIPTLNDDSEQITEMCKWICNNLGSDVPIHFTRFSPIYKLINLPATPISAIENAIHIAKDMGLEYVYFGNVPGHASENTYCPQCGKLLIKRYGFTIVQNVISGGKCPYCNYKISGIWN